MVASFYCYKVCYNINKWLGTFFENEIYKCLHSTYICLVLSYTSIILEIKIHFHPNGTSCNVFADTGIL